MAIFLCKFLWENQKDNDRRHPTSPSCTVALPRTLVYTFSWADSPVSWKFLRLLSYGQIWYHKSLKLKTNTVRLDFKSGKLKLGCSYSTVTANLTDTSMYRASDTYTHAIVWMMHARTRTWMHARTVRMCTRTRVSCLKHMKWSKLTPLSSCQMVTINFVLWMYTLKQRFCSKFVKAKPDILTVPQLVRFFLHVWECAHPS